jgi:TRAP-type C4-dicarboxylate transport system permease small subunit
LTHEAAVRTLICGASSFINSVVRRVAIATLLMMFLTMLVQILARYGFNSPPTWTEEVARYLMVWTGLLGATMSFYSRSDAVLMENALPARWSRVAHAVQSVATLTFLLPVIYFSFFSWRGAWGQGYLGRASRLTADTLGFSMAYISVAVPICALIVVIHLLARWAHPNDKGEPANR